MSGADLAGGGRFRVVGVPGDPPLVLKTGPAAPLAREAQALRLAAASGVAPRLVAQGPGVIVSERLPGGPRPLRGLGDADAHALGALIARTHAVRRSGSARLPGWGAAARSLAGYRRRRAADAAALASTPAERDLAQDLRAGERLAADPQPFRFLHGDLVEENIVWTPGGPRLVDWEFWRMGDPAEDLAYLAEVNALTGRACDAVVAGYDDAQDAMARRCDAWRALVALDAGLWYRRAGQEARARALVARAVALGRP